MPLSRILVVDDETAMHRVVRRSLSGLAVEVITTTCVDEAKACIEEGVDLVITDVMLAGRSGVEVARAAKQSSRPPPVIAMSGYAPAEDQIALAEAGIAGFMAKPFLPDALRELVERVAAD